MYRFKSTTQDLPDLFVDGLNLFGHGMRKVWLWSLIGALLGNLGPQYILEPTVDYVTNTIHANVNWTLLIFALLSSFVSAFCMGMITRRLFVMGADHHESNLGSMKIVIHKFLNLYAGLVLTALVTFLGLMLFIIPGFVFMMTFIFVMPLIILDDYHVFSAIKQSWNLVWDNLWRTVGMFLFPIMVIVVNYTVHLNQFPFLLMVLQTAVMWFAMPMLISFVLTLFYDAKLRHNVPLHLEEDFIDPDWEGGMATEPAVKGASKTSDVVKKTSSPKASSEKKSKPASKISKIKSKITKKGKDKR